MTTTLATVGAERRSVGSLLSRGGAKVLHGGAWRFRHYECVWAMVQRELASTVRVPLRVRPALWRRGFLSESWVLYDLARNDWRQYVSDYDRFTRTRLINGRYAPLLDNKLLFERLIGDTGLTPRFHGILEKGRLLDPMGPEPVAPAGERLAEILRQEGALVLKPLTGGGAHGIMTLRPDGNGATRDGTPIDGEELARLANGCDNYMACAFVEQHPALAAIYPHSTNSLRVLTMQDEASEPFIAAAVLRLGNDEIAPRENWTRGGLSAGIDPRNGRLGLAVRFPKHSDHLVWHAVHPDTGTAIDGASVPHWDRIARELLELVRTLPVLKYVGWDVVVGADGFHILEGNNYSDVNLLQVHGPLLADERVRAFYRRHGVGSAR